MEYTDEEIKKFEEEKDGIIISTLREIVGSFEEIGFEKKDLYIEIKKVNCDYIIFLSDKMLRSICWEVMYSPKHFNFKKEKVKSKVVIDRDTGQILVGGVIGLHMFQCVMYLTKRILKDKYIQMQSEELRKIISEIVESNFKSKFSLKVGYTEKSKQFYTAVDFNLGKKRNGGIIREVFRKVSKNRADIICNLVRFIDEKIKKK